jgi:hypothetical protein
MGPGSWNNTKWEIFDDLSVIKTDEYLDDENPRQNPNKKETSNYTIKQEDYDALMGNIALAKTINKVVDACDGEAWTFVDYNDDGSIKWMRETGYIYGLEPLEKISSYLLTVN